MLVRRIGSGISLVTLCAAAAMAVDGVAVSIHSSYTHAFGWAFGNIERFIITNNVPGPGTVIYSAPNGQRARCVSISPRGTRIAFIREDGRICIKSIESGGAVTVLASIPADAWIDWPTEDYVYYTNRWQGNELWRVNTSGTPSPVRVATGLQSAMQFSVDTSGTRGTAVTCCYSARSWTLSGSTITLVTNNGGCGAGISPSGRYFTNNGGDHASVTIRNFNGSQLHYFTAGACANAGSHWNRNRWSANSDDWVTFTQGTPYQLENGHHQVLYKKDGSQCIQVQPYRAGVYYEGDDFWVGTLGPVPPAINLSTTSLSFRADIGGANPAGQTVAVTNGGGGTLPALSVSEDAPWLTVTVSGGGNSQTLTNVVNIAGLAGNIYRTTVTVSGSGVSAVQYTVQLTVMAPPVLTTLTVTPSAAYVQPGRTQQFTASGTDQYGAAIATGTITWSVSGGGTISTTGLFTAGQAEGGPHTVTARSGTVSGTAQVTIAATPPLHLKVNSGGPAVEGWVAGSAYVSGGEDFSFGVTPSLSGVTNPAPGAVYQTVRHRNHTYNFPASLVPNGTYTVRLHFVDQYDSDRRMNYTIEGVTVLSNFNPANAAGGTNRALVREFTVHVTDGNGMQIVADQGQGNDVFEAGIEVIGGSSTPARPPVRIRSPNGGETYRVGDTLRIEWEWDTTITGGVAVWFSPDDGENWAMLTPSGSIPSHATGTTRGTFAWPIRPTVTVEGRRAISTVSTECRVRVWEYTLNELADISDQPFSIVDASTVAARWPGRVTAANLAIARTKTGNVALTVTVCEPHEVSVYALDGGCVAVRSAAAGPSTHVLEAAVLRSGTYVARVRAAGIEFEKRFVVHH